MTQEKVIYNTSQWTAIFFCPSHNFASDIFGLATPLLYGACSSELLRGRVEVPAGTNTLADVFWRNISASGCVPPGTSARRNKSAMTLEPQAVFLKRTRKREKKDCMGNSEHTLNCSYIFP